MTPAYWPPKIEDYPVDAIEPELNTNFEENAPKQEEIIYEVYERQEMEYLQELSRLHIQVHNKNLVQWYLPKWADFDKILKIIWRKVLKGTQVPATVKEIQSRYLKIPYFKDVYLY